MSRIPESRWVVYPDKDRRRFYRVFVFETREQLRVHHREQNKRVGISTRGAMEAEAHATFWITRDQKHRRCCGNVCFHRGYLGSGVVAHEMAHAALYALKGAAHFPVRLTKAEDEKLASMVGRLVRQFWNRFYARYKVTPKRRGYRGGFALVDR